MKVLLNVCRLQILRERARYSRRSDRAGGQKHEVGVAAKVVGLHDVVLVKLDGLRAEIEDVGDFLHGPAFAEELNDLALARSEVPGEMASADLCVARLRGEVAHYPTAIQRDNFLQLPLVVGSGDCSFVIMNNHEAVERPISAVPNPCVRAGPTGEWWALVDDLRTADPSLGDLPCGGIARENQLTPRT